MKSINLRLVSIICWLSAMLPGCVTEYPDGCIGYTLSVQVVDQEGNDISNLVDFREVEIYIFDQGHYKQKALLDLDASLVLDYDRNKVLDFVIWANHRNDTLSVNEPDIDDQMHQPTISLNKRTKSKENEYIFPSDLYYAYFQADGSQLTEEVAIKIPLKRKMASMTISTVNLLERYNYPKEGFYYKVRGLKDAITFSGEPTGNTIEYHYPDCYFGKDDELYAPAFTLFPSGQGQGQEIAIDLYHGDKLIYTVNSDADGNPIRVVEGKQTDIFIDFRHATIIIKIEVNPWGTVHQDVETGI
ncbi:MAG: FimB/Mfa2 family fimbrial subunit [Dysgonomonas sp.]|nr:FimB/Mfa2 family fimbrial subunit [Dysgonomonas sp.]